MTGAAGVVVVVVVFFAGVGAAGSSCCDLAMGLFSMLGFLVTVVTPVFFVDL